ncbi:lantibiotic biosynthesis protein [Tenacibaculum sp. 190524A02b]|uniref:Lantibiotic biosynthesis protein n=1 Tax=Tenacibaculum vairaonense TaxID=3137860 RepID=A0ABP1FBI0_9FLAO
MKRNFIVGDEWVYYKVYSGVKTSDKILLNIIKPVANQLLSKNLIDKWFFIRYSDPKHHLRIRFHLVDVNKIGEVINTLFKELNSYYYNDVIWKVQLDSYQREIERYGSNTMVYSEYLFFYDSNMVVNFLDAVKDDEIRWLFSLKAIDSHLDQFGYPLEEKLSLLERLKIGYRSEFGKSKALNKGLNDRYRLNQKKIKEILEEKNSEYSPILTKILNEKNYLTKKTIKNIQDISENKKLEVDYDRLNMSYIHMLMNRLFRSKNRAHEMVCYDFLYRYYQSKVARMKYQKN